MKTTLSLLLLLLCQLVYSQDQKSLDLSLSNAKNDSDKVKIYLQASENFLKKSRDMARANAQAALNICNRKNLISLKSASLLALAKAVRYTSNFEIVFKYDEEAIASAKLSENNELLFNAQNAYAQDLTITSTEVSKITEILEALKKYAEQNSDAKYDLHYKFTQGTFDYKFFKRADARKHFEECVLISEKIDDKYMVAKSKIRFFQTKIFSGIIDTTAKLAFEAMFFFDKEGYQEEAAYCRFIIGESYRLHGNLNKAFEYYDQAYPVFMRQQNHLLAGGVQSSLMQTYMMQQKYELEKEAIDRTEAHYKALNYEIGLGFVKSFRAHYYSAMGDFKKADKLFDEAEAAGKRLNFQPVIAISMSFRAQHLEKQSKTGEADSLALKGFEMMSKITSKELINNLYRDSDKYSQSQKKLYFDSSYRKKHGPSVVRSYRETNKIGDSTVPIYQPVLSSFDSTLSVAFSSKLFDIETQYKTRLIADSLLSAQQNAMIARQQMKNNTIILFSVVAISLLLLVGFALQVKSRKTAEKDKQHIQLLQNEIHHRVKNNLGVIQRLVDVAGKNAVDDVPLSSLKTRIKSIELLHTHLYSQQAKPGNISLQAYLEDLCLAIAATFESGKNIKVNVQAAEELNGNIAEKLGLIVNEVVTNSYKYAFEGKEEGIINITAQKEEKNMQIAVQDNGIGFETEKIKNNYGMKLIKGLSHELNAKYFFRNNSGTQFQLSIPV